MMFLETVVISVKIWIKRIEVLCTEHIDDDTENIAGIINSSNSLKSFSDADLWTDM